MFLREKEIKFDLKYVISNRSAAHCVWKKPVKYLKFAFSKYQADFDRMDETTQIRDVEKIFTRPEYIDVRSNYGSDIAVVFLSNPVKFTEHVRPACLDWDLSSTAFHLESGRIGRVSLIVNAKIEDNLSQGK